MNQKSGKFGPATWLVPGIAIGWEVLAKAGVLDSLFFPPPSRILMALAHMISTGEWQAQLGSTAYRMMSGVVPGAAVGVACGLLMTASLLASRTLGPFLSALNSTPKLALMPLLLLLLGVGEAARVLPVALTAFVTLAMQTADAARALDPAYVELARNYGTRGLTLLRRVYLPASAPQLFTAMRIAVGRCLVITISVELLSAPDGLGHLIWVSWQTMATEKLYVGVLTTTLLGMLTHQGLARLERRLAPWAVRTEFLLE